jgi:hypothetical protein
VSPASAPGASRPGPTADTVRQRCAVNAGIPRLAPTSNDPVVQPDCLAHGEDDVFLRRPVGSLPGRLPQPHALAHACRIDPGADGIDGSGPSWFGTSSGNGSGPPRRPLRAFQSVGLTPETATAIRTSPAAGSGTGRSTTRSTSGPPVSE